MIDDLRQFRRQCFLSCCFLRWLLHGFALHGGDPQLIAVFLLAAWCFWENACSDTSQFPWRQAAVMTSRKLSSILWAGERHEILQLLLAVGSALIAESHTGQRDNPCRSRQEQAGALWLGQLSGKWVEGLGFRVVRVQQGIRGPGAWPCSPAEPPSCALARPMLVPGHKPAQRSMTHDNLACSGSWMCMDPPPYPLSPKP